VSGASRAAVCAFATGLLGCAGLLDLEPATHDPRMLRATIGPGADRIEREVGRDPVVLDLVAGQGRPDYLWAPAVHELVLLYLAADRAVHLAGPPRERRLVQTLEPIPDAWLDLVAPEDRNEVLARRADFAGRAGAGRPGWCESAEAPRPMSGSCLRDPSVAALVEEIREKVMDAWRAPHSAHGGERVIVRFRVAGSGALRERCALGATSPRAAQAALEAFDAAFPVPPLGSDVGCAADASMLARFEIETD
jgi:hypothetical protein